MNDLGYSVLASAEGLLTMAFWVGQFLEQAGQTHSKLYLHTKEEYSLPSIRT
jgi:hypothetical protein